MNNQIATGHVMRCLAIADALRQLDENVIFLLADKEAVPLIESRGFNHIILNTQWDNMDDEIPVILSIIKTKKINKLLIDSYKVTKNYLSQFLFNSEEFSFYYYIDGIKYQSRGKIKGPQCKGRLDIINPNFVDYSKSIENCVNKIIKIYKTRFMKRDIEPLYYTGTSIQFNDLKPSELEFTPGEFFKDYNLTESVLSLYDLNP